MLLKKPSLPNETMSFAGGDSEINGISRSVTQDRQSMDMSPDSTEPMPKVVIDPAKHEECIAAGQINSLGVQLAELSLRLAKIEQRLTACENNSGTGQQAAVDGLKSSIQQLRSVSSQVEIITEGLRSTPGYNIGKTFNCGSCGSMGVVAVQVKCTKCGKENWWGWWPQKK